MKIVCISDTHALSEPKDLPEGDVLIHAGDLSLAGEVHEIQKTLAWLRRFPHRYKIFIAGNHDNALERHGLAVFWDQMKAYKDRSPLIYLQDSFCYIPKPDGTRFKVFGSPSHLRKSVYRVGARAFTREADSNNRFWGMAPECDILVTHCPPQGFNDQYHEVLLDGRVLVANHGDAAIRAYVDTVRPELVVHGHIHSGYGKSGNEFTTIVNAAHLNDQYKPQNEPIVVEL